MIAAQRQIGTAHSSVRLKSEAALAGLRLARASSWLRPVLAVLCMFVASVSVHAQTVTTSVTAGKLPFAVAVNPVTNKSYVVNSGDTTVTAIDGLTNTATPITVGTNPIAVAVNPITNLIYVVNSNASGTVSVINGATNTVTGTINVGGSPSAVAVNPVSNKIYVANKSDGTVTVIDANNSNSTTALSVGSQPSALAVNPITNQIYVANFGAASVSVINGATNGVGSPISVLTGPTAIAVNTVTNEIYVADYSSAKVSVISGTSVIASVTTGSNPNAIAVNPVTNKIYVADAGSANITVIDGANNNTGTLLATPGNSTNFAIAVNPVTNQVYVATQGTNSITVINGAAGVTTASINTTLASGGTTPHAVAVNPITGKIYVANLGIASSASTVTVVDGATNATVSASTGATPLSVAVNPVTNKIYIANSGSTTVTVIDGTNIGSPTTVTVGHGPNSVAVNPITNKIYVVNGTDKTVSVIDGSNNTVVGSPITVGNAPVAVAVNPVLNRIYVANSTDGNVTVIDGTGVNPPVNVGAARNPAALAINPVTNMVYVVNSGATIVTTIDGANNQGQFTVGNFALSIAVNTITNKIYVANFNDNTVTVADGNNGNATTPISVGTNPISVAVNQVTNKIYVANNNSSNVTVIDANNGNATSLIPVGTNPATVVVNPVTNKIYALNQFNIGGNTSTITIIDGATKTASTVDTALQPAAAAVNPFTNAIFVANQFATTTATGATVLTEQPVQSIAITTTIQPLAGNQTTSLTPAFTFTTSNTFTNGAAVDSVLYQLDTWQGTWTAATAGSGNFTATLPTLQPGLHILYAYASDGEEGTSTITGLQSNPLIGSIAAYEFLVAPVGATLSPNTFSFGNQAKNTTSAAPQTATLTNGGAQTLNFAISSTDSTEFIENSDSCTTAAGHLASGASCTISISFKPIVTGSLAATLTVTDNSNGIPNSTQTISMSGFGTGTQDPGLAWTPPSTIVYGTNLTAIQTATFQAPGNDGSLTYSPVSGVLGVGPHNLSVTFNPNANGSLTYTSSTVNVTVTVTAAPVKIIAGAVTAPFGTTPAYTATYSGLVNGDLPGIITGTPTYTVTPVLNPMTVAGGPYTITPHANNLAAPNYVFSDANVQTSTLTVVKANPPITWGTGGVLPAITFGTKLSGSLNATTAVTGSAFTYTENGSAADPNAMLAVGTYTLVASFNPTDTADYNTPGSATVTLTVNKPSATVVVTTSGTSALTYGTPVIFSASVTSAASTPTGTVTFYDAASGATCSSLGVSLAIGSAQPLVSGNASVTTATIKVGLHTILGCYSGDTNYLATGNSVSQNVNIATPVIIWPTPDPVGYGTALSAVQLDATTANNVAGVFTYNPVAGTVMGAGTQTLGVQFVPSDTVDYLSTTFSVQLIVNQAPANSQATVTTTAIVGTTPKAVVTNPATNITYVANFGSASVTILNGATNAVLSVPVGNQPDAIAVNPATNQIYVANSGDGTITVIDGASNTASAPIATGTNPTSIAVDPVRNRVYVVNQGSATVSVLSGAVSGGAAAAVIASPAVGTNPYGVAVNTVTNLIYVTNQGGNSVSVVNGASPAAASTTIPSVGSNPYGIAVNAVTNRIFVTNKNGTTVAVINAGSGNTITPVNVGIQPSAVAVNPVTNKAYVANSGSGTVTVIDGNNSFSTSPVTVGANPTAVAVNAITNQIYVVNQNSATFTVIDGSSNTPANVAVASGPDALSVNPVTDKVYVANGTAGTVSVVDGATNTTAVTGTGNYPSSVAVNPVTNTVYVANYGSNSVTVIGASSTTTVPVGNSPTAVAVNPSTNQVYVVNSNSVTLINGANNATTPITVGNGPNAVAINPVTNRIYVTNYVDASVSVIDGNNSNTVIGAVTVGIHPDAVAVNPVTNKIYVASVNQGNASSLGNVTVIDGATNVPSQPIAAGDNPISIAVNPATNKIYVANLSADLEPGPGTVTIIDGVTNNPTQLTIAEEPFAVAVNPLTNLAYVVDKDGNSVTVIDGSNHPTTLSVGTAPFAIAINPVTNKIYVPNAGAVSGNYYISVIDGATNFVTTLSAGAQPAAVAVNPVTNEAYIANQVGNNVTTLIEQQVQTIPIVTTIAPLANNSTTSVSPSFTFTAANNFTPGTPVDGLYYQVDTWQGTWTAATSGGSGSFTGTTNVLLPGYHIIYAYATEGQEGTTTAAGPQGTPLIGNIAAYGFLVAAQGSSNGVSVSPSTLNYAGQILSTPSTAQTITLANANNSILTFSVAVSGANASDFVESSSAPDTCKALAGHVPANGTCNIAVVFTPAATGARSATLTITDSLNGGANNNQTVALTGLGTGSQIATISWTPGTISYGTPSASVPQPTASYQSNSVPGTYTYNPAISALGFGTTNVAVTLTPSDTTHFAVVTQTFPVTVVKAVLNVSSAVATRQFGLANPTFTPLYSGFVNGDTAAVVSGAATFATTATQTSSVGSYPVTVTTGTLSATNYTFTASAGSFSITPATTTVTWGPLTAITLGTALGSSQLNAIAIANGSAITGGTFTYNPPATTVLTSGPHTLTATYAPPADGNSIVDYTTPATASVTLQVNQATAIAGTPDTTTKGTWLGIYGGDGYSMAPSTTSLPPYATLQSSGTTAFTWASGTSDTRALQLPDGSSRIAAAWYNNSSFSFALNITDGKAHQVAFYVLDWDGIGRSETITLTDAVTNATLSSQSVSNFSGGAYLLWTVSGSVNINVLATGTGNALVNGLFFGGSAGAESVTVSPSNVTLSSGGSKQYSATIHNAVTQPVTWSIGSTTLTGAAMGTISSTSGLYSAPTTVAVAGTVVVTATTTDGNSVTGTATLNLSTTAVAGTSANFVPPQDNATGGTWIGTYGSDGAAIATVSTVSVPSYATLSETGAATYAWQQVSSDPRAPETNVGTGRTAATWYTNSTGGFSFSLNLTDTAVHQVSLYAIDWDLEGRAETVTITDPANNNAVLDSETISNFGNGVYLTWNISGNVVIKVVATGTGNAVASGVFFGGNKTTSESVTVAPSSTTLTSGGSKTFTATVTNGTTQTVTWSISSTTLSGAAMGTISASTGLYSAPTTVSTSGAVTVTATTTDGKSVTGTATVNLSNGVSTTGNTATFIPPADTTTSGTWLGVYGNDGAAIATVTSVNLPSYATLTETGATTYAWQQVSSDPRAPETNVGTGRTAAAWYTNDSNGFTFNLNMTAGVTHKVSLYAVDWDLKGRTQTITVMDPANSNAVLDTQTISNFGNGVYLTWNMTGNVVIKVVATGTGNAVASGLFFGGAASPVESVTVAPSSTTLTSGGSKTFTATVANGTSQTVTWSISSTTLSGAAMGTISASTGLYNAPATVSTAGAVTVTATTTDGNSVSGTATVTLSTGASGTGNTATFIPPNDTTTGGTWLGAYGNDGAAIATVTTVNLPSYATLTEPTAATYAWQQVSTDPRALETNVGTGRTASTWYTNASGGFSFNLNMTAGTAHKVSIYAVDWDNLGRTETFTVMDPANNSAVLDTETISNFGNGVYVTWNITGNVVIKVVATGTGNAVVSGVFFGGAASPVERVTVAPSSTTLTSGGSKTFTATVTNGTTQTVTWSISSTTLSGAAMGTISASTGLYSAPTTVSTAGAVTVTATTTDGNSVSGTATVTLSTGASGTGNTATFIPPADTTTSGTWLGVYGNDGAAIATVTSVNLPSYATLTETGATTYAWQQVSSDPRAPETNVGTGRTAAAWYTNDSNGFTFNLNMTAGVTHKVSLYAVDWDLKGRTQTITVMDPANSNAVLDTQTISNFGNGVYLTWNMTGNVVIKVVATGTGNAVASGLFFGGAASPVESVTVAPSSTTLTSGGSKTFTATVANGTSQTVTWSISSTTLSGAAMGTISASTGLYNAPATVSTAGAVTVTATTTDGNSVSGTATVTLSTGASGTGNTATFIPPNDTTTGGTWLGAYGNDGAAIATVTTVNLPSYATLTEPTAATYAWQQVSTDPRALETNVGTGRTASTWYTNASGGFSFNLNMTAGTAHKVSIYAVDWDNLGRTETFTVMDPANNSAVLDTETISNFGNGVYVTWNITGNVVIKVVATGTGNAVVSGVFFGGAASTVEAVTVAPSAATLASGGSKQFSATVVNGTTQTVTWSISSTTLTGAAMGTISASTGLYNAPATVSTAGAVTVKATTTDGNSVTGTATVNLSTTSGGASAVFVPPADTTTEGTWIGVYGTQGAAIATVTTVAPPSYASVTVNNAATYQWQQVSSDPRALETNVGTQRTASTWFSNESNGFTASLNLNDSATHQIEMYFVDWDNEGRVETITIMDPANNNAPLDSQQVSAFQNGKYLTWNITGNVTIKVTYSSGQNAVLSGIFFK